MAPSFSMLAVAASTVGQAKIDPDAPCQTEPTDECCYGNETAPVLGGIDFVDLADNKTSPSAGGTAAPLFGSAQYTAQLNGYTFRFVTQANAARFAADPWTYAPACGGFWGYGVGVESSIPNVALPPATITEPFWIRYNNRTFMEKGRGAYTLMLQDLDGAITGLDKNWAYKFGADRAKWPFNTLCCANQAFRRMAVCAPAVPMGGCYLKYDSTGRTAKAGVTACTVTAQGTCSCDKGYDIQNSGGGSSQFAATSADCCAACAADAQCKAAVFASPASLR